MTSETRSPPEHPAPLATAAGKPEAAACPASADATAQAPAPALSQQEFWGLHAELAARDRGQQIAERVHLAETRGREPAAGRARARRALSRVLALCEAALERTCADALAAPVAEDRAALGAVAIKIARETRETAALLTRLEAPEKERRFRFIVEHARDGRDLSPVSRSRSVSQAK